MTNPSMFRLKGVNLYPGLLLLLLHLIQRNQSQVEINIPLLWCGDNFGVSC